MLLEVAEKRLCLSIMVSKISRIQILSVGVCTFALLIIVRLFFLQVVHGEAYSQSANKQYVRPAGGVFDRGSIYFTEKNGDLRSAATVRSGFILAINPTLVTDNQKYFELLNKIVELDKAEFLKKSAKKGDPYEEVAHRMTQEEADKVLALDLPGVTTVRERWRFYPGDSLASHTLGFVGWGDDGIQAGRYGLERYYQDSLSRGEEKLYVNFFAEAFGNLSKTVFDNDSGESDIITTIEPSVQNALEVAMQKVKDSWDSSFTGGIVMDPNSGAIYAMTHLPGYDLNNFSSVKDPEIYRDPIVENVYEFGSVVKPLTMAAAIDSGAVTPSTTYEDKGFLQIGPDRISNFDKKGRGVVTMQEVLSKSLNTGTTFAMQKMGHNTFKKYMLSYGLDEKTGIDLPDETSGIVTNLDSKRDIEYATASFGQGIAITPIEMIRALASVVNGGYLVTPHLARAHVYKDPVERTKEIVYEKGAQVLKPETSETLQKMLTTVVDTSLLNGSMKLEHYRVGAKTGTAQIPDPTGGYYSDRYMHSFFGFFPSYDPKFIIFLYNYYPKGVDYASHTLTEPFFNVAKFLISYYDIPPDR